MSTISRGVPRVDARTKAGGEARYLADVPIEGVLTAGLVLSGHAHARLVSVDPPPLPEGYVTVDHRDIPGRNAVSMINDGWPLFPESTVEYAGEPIALIAGPDPAVVRRLVDETRIVCEELPAVLGFDAAEARRPQPEPPPHQLSSSSTRCRAPPDRVAAARARRPRRLPRPSRPARRSTSTSSRRRWPRGSRMGASP